MARRVSDLFASLDVERVRRSRFISKGPLGFTIVNEQNKDVPWHGQGGRHGCGTSASGAPWASLYRDYWTL